MVDNDGLIGVALSMGGESTLSRAIVQSAGSARPFQSKRLMDGFNSHGDIPVLLLRYPIADYADVTHDRLQSASLGGSAVEPPTAARDQAR